MRCAARSRPSNRNEKYQSLTCAALGRQRADWLYGMNLTRLYTVRARAAGYSDILSVGRVQTPLLGLIVRRDREIESFVTTSHFGVRATLRTGAGEEFHADWAVGKDCADHTDAEGRLLDRSVAQAVATKTARAPARVVTYAREPRSKAPPLPYSLASLQIDAGRRLGLSAAVVLELAQSLYEKHRVITYPRSDCMHLPEAHFSQARGVLDAIARLGVLLFSLQPTTVEIGLKTRVRVRKLWI